MYYVYVLKNLKNNRIYFGYTKDLKRRFNEHNQDSSYELTHYEAYKSEQDARERERQLKYYGKALGHLKNRLRTSLR